MADYSDAASNANDALTTSSDGLIEEYEISPRGRRVKRGKASDQIKAALLLEGLAARRGGRALCNVAKFKAPR
jgi:hypothetical protein